MTSRCGLPICSGYRRPSAPLRTNRSQLGRRGGHFGGKEGMAMRIPDALKVARPTASEIVASAVLDGWGLRLSCHVTGPLGDKLARLPSGSLLLPLPRGNGGIRSLLRAGHSFFWRHRFKGTLSADFAALTAHFAHNLRDGAFIHNLKSKPL